MIEIEILEMTRSQVTAAFYYPVTRLPAAEDQSRTPRGSSLLAAQIQDLRDGKVFELIFDKATRGGNVAQIQAKLVQAYKANRQRALGRYTKLYSGGGTSYDGSQWT